MKQCFLEPLLLLHTQDVLSESFFTSNSTNYHPSQSFTKTYFLNIPRPYFQVPTVKGLLKSTTNTLCGISRGKRSLLQLTNWLTVLPFIQLPTDHNT